MVLVAGCGHDPVPAFSIGGTVAGLSGAGLVLKNGSSTLAVSQDGRFVFPGTVMTGGRYSVSVVTQPSNPAQYCTVSNGSGTLTSADVSNVSVACTTLTVGGTIKGYSGSGLVLTLNGGNNFTIPSGATTFTFPSELMGSHEYQVFFASEPLNPTQSCTITSAHGFVTTASVSNVSIICDTNATYALQGSFEIFVPEVDFNHRLCCDIITFYADGTFTEVRRCPTGEVQDATGGHCYDVKKQAGGGVYYGVYNFDAATGAFTYVRYAEPADAVSNSPYTAWTMHRCTAQEGAPCWSGLSTGPGSGIFLRPIGGAPGTLAGGFASRVSPDVVIFRGGGYAVVTTQAVSDRGIFAGVEWGCYSQTGSSSGSIIPDFSSSCDRAYDTNGTAGFADLSAVSYVITGPNTLQLGDGASTTNTYERVIPN